MRIERAIVLTLALSLLTPAAGGQSSNGFDATQLEGEWEGTGEFLMPVTNIAMGIAGKAAFTWDSANGYLRTAIVGTKFLFKYSDSGHLIVDPTTDSISWEVWDNWGKHALYHGLIEDGVIKGSRRKGDGVYSVSIAMATLDSIDFKLTYTNDDGSSRDRATFSLWRLKD